MHITDYSTLEEIASVIAHEVKNPLNLIRANINILENEDNNIFHKKNYSMIRNELEKVNDIMVDFISLANPINNSNLDLIYIVDILSEIVNNNCISYYKKVNLSLEAKDKDLCILGDEKSLKTLFNNIIKNALEAINYKGYIDLKVFEDVNENIVITIKDDGPGLDEYAKENICKKFFTTKSNGSGLGIFICNKVAEEHNGSFSLENHPEGGCIAKVILPKYI